jgi:hypothetical protein
MEKQRNKGIENNPQKLKILNQEELIALTGGAAPSHAVLRQSLKLGLKLKESPRLPIDAAAPDRKIE